MRRLLLYKTGQSDPQLSIHVGDYERWFSRVLDDVATLEVHEAFERPACCISGYDGVVITGSPRSLVDPEPWMDDAAAFVRSAAQAGVPVLGVCFGHQLIGYAFGARVRQNPNGWEAGTHEIDVTDDGQVDLLFAGLPTRLRVNQSHRDEVFSLPAEARLLASGALTEAQAIAVGPHVRGVQFHPEIDGAVIRRLLTHRQALLSDDAAKRGKDRDAHVPALLERSRDTPDGERVLRNFVEHFIRAA